jgi:uncharacterized protein YdhG (YjbR/CyaY superfamily)
MAAKRTARPDSIDAYLAGLNAAQRAALQKLRKTIRAAAPRAEECISYSLPAFRLDGRVLVCFGASINHCSFFPGSGTAVATHADLLKRYDTSKGTIRFPPEEPLPAGLVRTIVKARIAENADRAGKTASKRAMAKKRPAELGQNGGEVTAYLAKLDHPLKGVLDKLRRLLLGIGPAIREGIKWNSPSFRTSEWFATINVCGAGCPPRPKDPPSLRIILHAGAKPTAAAKTGLKIADPQKLLKWLGKDRALVTLDSAADFRARQADLKAILREWIRQM